MQIHVGRDGTPLGEFSLEEVNAGLASGKFLPTDLGWYEGMENWKPLSSVPGVFIPARRGAAPPLPPSVPAGAPIRPAPRQQPMRQQPAQAMGGRHGGGRQVEIPNYLPHAIVATILCCLPLGVVAIVFASKADGLQSSGDIEGARAAAAKAKNWVIAAVVCSAICLAIYTLPVLFALLFGTRM